MLTMATVSYDFPRDEFGMLSSQTWICSELPAFVPLFQPPNSRSRHSRMRCHNVFRGWGLCLRLCGLTDGHFPINPLHDAAKAMGRRQPGPYIPSSSKVSPSVTSRARQVLETTNIVAGKRSQAPIQIDPIL